MHTHSKTADYDCLEVPPAADSLDEIWSDDDFFDDLVDAVNRNFVLEVEAAHAEKN